MTIVYFILMLGIIIFIHEFGHMLLAKLFGVYVNEFALGFGPKLWSKQGKETLYSLRAIPLGGFNGLVENEETVLEQDAEGNPTKILTVPKDRTFYGISPWKRIIVLLAGPVFNLMLAMVVFVSIFQITGFINEYPAPYIASVMPGSPAEEAGLLAGDLITKLEYKDGTVTIPETFYDVIISNSSNKDTVTVYVMRDGNELSFRVTPRLSKENNQYIIGITSGDLIQKKLTFFTAIPEGIKYCWNVIKLTFTSIIGLFTGRASLDNLGGTISIYRYTEEAASYGFTSVLSLMGSLSVSVGLMNLIPISIFDGGKIVITLIEIILGHRLNEKAENIINMIGMGLVFGLFILVTVLDIMKLFR